MIYKLGELFSGPGGLALGAMNAKVQNGSLHSIVHAWSNDFDESSCDTYTNNICPEAPESVICQDVRTLDIDTLSPIDGFAYGFPCNDFSIVGEKKGFDGDFGPLYLYGVNIINKLKPKFFVAENVGGLSSSGGGRALEKILADLAESGNGYNLTVHLYNAAHYGVPQARNRIIIVGIDKTYNLKFHVPAPTTKDRPVTALIALTVPPISETATNNELTNQSATVVERLKHIKAGENVWNANLPEHLKLNVKSAKLSQIYKRLDPNKPSYTITGSGGGGTHCYHWEEPRALTNRERARIQSFPDHYVFSGKKEQVRKQVGMAVPPKLAEAVFTAILKTFAGIEYAHIPANIDQRMVNQKAKELAEKISSDAC
ncbi:MAG: DNA cytosine methyltransferase [Sulfuriferula sp.]|nr:DNA cytosine methyltransferase [Sulfuriferula sp.]